MLIIKKNKLKFIRKHHAKTSIHRRRNSRAQVKHCKVGYRNKTLSPSNWSIGSCPFSAVEYHNCYQNSVCRINRSRGVIRYAYNSKNIGKIRYIAQFKSLTNGSVLRVLAKSLITFALKRKHLSRDVYRRYKFGASSSSLKFQLHTVESTLHTTPERVSKPISFGLSPFSILMNRSWDSWANSRK